LSLGVKRPYGVGLHVVIEHCHALAGQVVIQYLAVTAAGHQGRLVVGIRARQQQLRVGRFIAIGGAEEIHRPLLQRLDHLIAGVITPNLDGDMQGLADQCGKIGRDTFEFVVVIGQVKRCVIGRRNAHQQCAPLTQPTPTGLVQRHLRGLNMRVPQQPQSVRLFKGHRDQR